MATQPPPAAPAGWYPDPDDHTNLWYWDGQQWAAVATDQPPIPKESKRTLLVVGLAGLAVLIGLPIALILNNAANSSTSVASSTPSSVPVQTPTTTTTSRTTTVKVTPPPAPVGSVVRDGDLQFTVVEVSRAKTVGDSTANPYLTTTAQGEFVVVTLAVTNVGANRQNYYSQNQRLIDAAGVEHEPSNDADIYMNAGDGNPMGAVSPGSSVRFRIAFDVPPGTVAATLRLHQSLASDGVGIRLS